MRRWLIVGTCAGLICGCGERGAPEAPALPPYVALRGPEVVAVDPGPRVIGRAAEFVLVPDRDVSPDGRRVASVTGAGLMAAGIEGRQGEVVVTGTVSSPRWSPDGRFIAFVRARSVAVVAAGGGPVREVAVGECPEWMPDGRALLISHPARDVVRLHPLRGGADRVVLRGVRCPRLAPG